MAKMLQWLGLLLLAGAAWFLIGGEAGWVDPGRLADWAVPMGQAGGVCLAVGLALRILARVMRRLSQSRCVRCSAPTERGQSYCLDHLQQSVNEARDAYHREQMFRPRRNR